MVHVRFTKWDGSLHWHFDVKRLGEDEHGHWLGGPEGTPVRRGCEPPIASPPFALLIPEGAWWTATFNLVRPDSPFGLVVYVDICTPAQWTDGMATAIDLDLDVAMRPDGTVVLLDEDEFEEHRSTMAYPEHLVDRARASAAAIFTTMESRQEPFASVGPNWLERAQRLGEQ